jgi:Na+-driven multidrug efflux pump
MSIVAGFGTNAVTAYGIVLRLRMAVMMFGMGFGNATATIVGQNLGARKQDRAEHSAWLSCRLNELIMGSIGVMYFIFATPIVKVFNSTPEVVSLGVDFMHFVSIGLLFTAFSLVLGRAFQGAGDTLSPMIITSTTLLLVRITTAVMLARIMGPRGVWVALLVSTILNMIIITSWFKVGKWKVKEV